MCKLAHFQCASWRYFDVQVGDNYSIYSTCQVQIKNLIRRKSPNETGEKQRMKLSKNIDLTLLSDIIVLN